jgi:voltage-gated potassium channel
VLRLVLVTLGLTAVTVFIHGAGTMTAAGRVARLWARDGNVHRRLATELLMAQLVGMLILFHLAEALVWALFYLLIGTLPDLESAAYFSLTSYTTVGYGDVVLPEPWRLLGPLESTVGVLMLGWSTGVLVAVIGTIYRQLLQSPERDDGWSAGDAGNGQARR